jgi:hypothetical protein
MERLRDQDLQACQAVCPADATVEQCRSVCARAAAVNAIERGKIFNVPWRAPPINDLDTGTTDEQAWAALGSRAVSRMPFRAAQHDATALSVAGLPPPPVIDAAPQRFAGNSSLPGAFFGWNQPYNALFKPQFVPTADQQFARTVDLNQALAGYLVDPPPVQRDVNGAPLSWLKPTAGFRAAELPQRNPFAGEGFNLGQNVPKASVANVLDQPTLFQRSRHYGARAQRLANLAA